MTNGADGVKRLDSSGGMNLNDDGLTVAFAAFGEPLSERSGEARGVDAQTRFEAAFAGGQSVVKFGGAGEVAHAERVEPVEWAGLALAGDDYFHGQPSRVHGKSIAFPRGHFGGALAALFLLFAGS